MCRFVDIVVESICRDPLNRTRCIASISFLLLLSVEEPVGRPYASRKLGVGEKMLRNIYAELVERGFIERSKAGAYLSRRGRELLKYLGMSMLASGKCLCLVSCDRESLRELSGKIILLRDKIVISLEDPFLLEVIGFIEEGVVSLPGVEEPILSEYLDLLSSIAGGGPSVLGVFQGPCYKCCSSLLYSVYSVLRT